LLVPPPPDHCHISAYLLELDCPPKNCPLATRPQAARELIASSPPLIH
jgi:hypothetical protein